MKHNPYKRRHIERDLVAAGFYLDRTMADHRLWKHPLGHKVNTVIRRDGEMSDGLISKIYRVIGHARAGKPPELASR